MCVDKAEVKAVKNEPSVWNVNVDIPELFSFDINDATNNNVLGWQSSFRSFVKLFNKIAGRKELILPYYELTMLQIWLSVGKETMPKIILPEAKKMQVRLMFANYLLLPKLGKFQESIMELEALIVFLRQLDENDDEMLWYHICALRYRSEVHRNYKNSLINETLSCLRNLRSEPHRNATQYFLVEYAKNVDEYLDYEPFRELEQLFPQRPWRYDGSCALQRHVYILRHHVQNHAFFTFQNNPLMHQPAAAQKELELIINQKQSCLGQRVTVLTQIDIPLLLRFAAHLVPPSEPIFKLEIRDIDDYTMDQFNIALRRAMRAKGFCNSEGFLHGGPFQGEGRTNARFDQLTEIIMDLVESMIQRFATRAERYQYAHNNLKLNDLRQKYNELVQIAEQLSGLNGIDAMHLFYQSLQPHQYALDQNMVDEIKGVVLRSIEIAQRAKAINDADLSDSRKCDDWFALAGDCVNEFVSSKKLLLIQIGTPIKAGKTYSDHAIYVAAKYVTNSDDIHVIIINGGDKVSLFHVLSEFCNPKDREEYHYAALQPFKATQDYLAAFKHYIYRCVSIEFTKSLTDDVVDTDESGEIIGENQNTFSSQLRNIYLRTNKAGQEEYFLGYRYEKITVFRRQDLSERF